MRVERWKRRTTFANCPVGLFWFGDELMMKTQYHGQFGQSEAYIVRSGEFFVGGCGPELRGKLMVTPAKMSP